MQCIWLCFEVEDILYQYLNGTLCQSRRLNCRCDHTYILQRIQTRTRRGLAGLAIMAPLHQEWERCDAPGGPLLEWQEMEGDFEWNTRRIWLHGEGWGPGVRGHILQGNFLLCSIARVPTHAGRWLGGGVAKETVMPPNNEGVLGAWNNYMYAFLGGPLYIQRIFF